MFSAPSFQRSPFYMPDPEFTSRRGRWRAAAGGGREAEGIDVSGANIKSVQREPRRDLEFALVKSGKSAHIR